MSGPIFPRQRKGHKYRAADAQAVQDWLQRVARVTADPPLEVSSGAGGVHIRLAGYNVNLFAKTQSGGVGAMAGSTPGSGTCDAYSFDGSALTAAGYSVTAYNISASAVGANKFVVLNLVDGFWSVGVESC